MTLFSERWNGEKDRLDAYIIHYAGTGFGNRMEDLKRDAKLFYSDFPYPEHKNHLIIDAIGDAKSIMDVGCGEGILTRYLIKTFPDKEILAVDIEDKNRFGLKVEIGDLTDDFKYKAEVVIASEVLEHIRWWKDALQSLLEASTGKVIITIPYGHSFYNKDHVNFWDDESIKEFITLCDPHKVTVSKEITKPEDIKNNSLIYFITIQK
jgi:SAM-dependent methyltransferase